MLYNNRIRGTELYRQQKTTSRTIELKSNFSLNQTGPQWPRQFRAIKVWFLLIAHSSGGCWLPRQQIFWNPWIVRLRDCVRYFTNADRNNLYPEMPTSVWRPKIRRLSFFHYPSSPPPRKIDPAPNGNDLRHYMTSYMMHILSKFEIIVLMLEIIFVND